MTELIYNLTNMWKKNISFFLVFVIFLMGEIPYVTSIQVTEGKQWHECINYFYVFCWALPALVALCYIIFMRCYMPKARKETEGIAFFVVNANHKQFDAISKKFITQFQKNINLGGVEYSVIVIDDYHSQKYYPIFCKHNQDDKGEHAAKLLRRRRCRVAIFIDCTNGGDGEDLFCHMTMGLTITHRELPDAVRDFLKRDIASVFAPLREIDIMKFSETSDFSSHSITLDIICRYILASTSFHCGDFPGTIRMLEGIRQSILKNTDVSEAVIPIKNVLEDRFAVCYRVYAQYEYQKYCDDRDEKHLMVVRTCISNQYCKRVYDRDNKILEGICSFLLDKDIGYAIKCMDAFNKKDAVVKYNKVFLMMYAKCSTNNVFRAYNLYKTFGSLPNHVQDQIETFIFLEYKKDTSKKQLLFFLFLIYDYQNNTILAKRCLEQFGSAFPWILESELSSIFKELNERYKDVEYEEGEMYSI